MSRSPDGFDWSSDALAALSRLWAEGHSTSEIGRRLGGVEKRRDRQGAPARFGRPSVACRANRFNRAYSQTEATARPAPRRDHDGAGGAACRDAAARIRDHAHGDAAQACQPGATHVDGARTQAVLLAAR